MSWMGVRLELGQVVLCEYDSSGFLRAQPDGAGDARLGSFEVLFPLGFFARAPAAKIGTDGKPLGGGGCKAYIVKDGTEFRIELLGDQRDLAGIPPLPTEGGSVQYAPGSAHPSFDFHSGKDGTKQIYVEAGDAAHIVTIGNDGNGDPIVELVHARGMALTFLQDAAVLKNRTGSCYVELTDAGGNLNGNWKVTGAFDVGAVSFPLVKFPPLAAELTAVQTALTAIGAALTALGAIPTNVAAAPACGAAATSIGVALAALGVFTAAGPTILTKGS